MSDRPPYYARILRLKYLRPGGLLCFFFFEGAIALATLLAMAELVSWWAVLVLPGAVAAMVKINDVIAGFGARSAARAHARAAVRVATRNAAKRTRRRQVKMIGRAKVPQPVVPLLSLEEQAAIEARRRQSASHRYD
ncbi:hypothetical protein [Hamadaea tsunoensis]|uniref:hypothetical protein n=1 Tax=Hamadaea tsunoensis TaxID=53368 RepID=UPI00041F6252|nr:hypothetical protein [Hamadaea tsunoensis]